MHSNADIIRDFAGRFVEEARKEGQSVVTILAGQIVKDLNLNNRVPAVCSALASKRFQQQNRIVLVKREGPKSGQSTTARFTYQISDALTTDQPEAYGFASLRGAGKEALTALGGGEVFVREQRKDFGAK